MDKFSFESTQDTFKEEQELDIKINKLKLGGKVGRPRKKPKGL